MNISRLVIATRNRGKLREFRQLLANTGSKILGLEDLGIGEDFEETGSSFVENARLKARNYSLLTDLPVLGDDSGLEVVALGGRPGIHSARYAGPHATDLDRVRKLLAELDETGANREARFVCALALARRGVVLLDAEGECRGIIAPHPLGDRGFGYDPIFLFPELGRTYAELAEEEKNRFSHRARAVESLFARIADIGA
jgi:XTP/dITP diphosphohydrolase